MGALLNRQRKAPKTGGPTRQRRMGQKYRIDSSISPVAKSRVIDRMKEEAKALGGSFFTAA